MHRCWAPMAVATLLLAGCGDAPDRVSAPTPARAAARTACPPGAPLRVDARVGVGRRPGPLAIAGDSLWVARPGAGELVSVRLDADPRADRRVRVGGSPVSLAAAAEHVFVADRDGDRILRLADTSRPALWGSISAPVKLVVAQEKLFAVSLDDGALHVMSPLVPGTGVPVAIPAIAPIDAVHEAGELWVLGGSDRGVSPFAVQRNASMREGLRMPTLVVGAMAAGAGHVWAALPTAHGVARIDPVGPALGVLRASRGFRPTVVAVDDCSVWLGDAGGRIERIDPVDGRLLGPPVRIGRSVGALVAHGGGVWASDPLAGTVLRVVPRG